ncbi:hypothetical protein [Streptomyces sp. NPDC001137]|uniref:hypothetical protein n=1 Tax=Streptomyces sp. NPDC001137 TaxID=3154378 RepID=UPI003325931B
MASAALLVTLNGASASAATQPSDEAISAALRHVGDGTYTQADLNLIKSVPGLAARVVDPTKPEEVTIKEAVVTPGVKGGVSAINGSSLSSKDMLDVMPPAGALPSTAPVWTPEETEADGSGSASASAVAATGDKWRMTHITHTHRSLTGAIIFRYHTYAEFRYGGGKVREWGERYDDFSDYDPVVSVNVDSKREVDTKSRVPASSGSSMMKRKAELCVAKYGCYATLHPWAKVKVYGTGKTAIAGSGV